jgi:hypothetical protein
MRLSPQTVGEQISAFASIEGGKPLADSDTGLFGDFELNRSAGLLLDYRCPIANPPARAHIVDLEPNEVAALSLLSHSWLINKLTMVNRTVCRIFSCHYDLLI